MLIVLPTLAHPAPLQISDDATFDAFVRRALAEAHDGVLREAVPDRLLSILRQSPGLD